jgi:hypothetical protein
MKMLKRKMMMVMEHEHRKAQIPNQYAKVKYDQVWLLIITPWLQQNYPIPSPTCMILTVFYFQQALHGYFNPKE